MSDAEVRILPALRLHEERMDADRDLYASTTIAVAELVGGLENLASMLNVNVSDLQTWSEGKGRPPTQVFLRIVDIKTRSTRAATHRQHARFWR
jgi:hypothetical protein